MNGLKPVIDRVFPFEQAPEALRIWRAATHVGKVVDLSRLAPVVDRDRDLLPLVRPGTSPASGSP